MMGSQKHTFQLSVDILNVANLINSDWGVRKIARATAITPLEFTTDGTGNQFDSQGRPFLHYKGGDQETFIDDPSIFSRWQMQIGLRYLLD